MNREPSQSQSAYSRLLAEIVSGGLQPGDRLVETELAERLKISRTPVREAIRLLEADGLVVHVPRLGATVRSLNQSELMELYEVRAVLEGAAASMAARSASDIEIAELEAINTELAGKAGQDAAAVGLNRQFHRLLLEAARNRFLARSMDTLSKTLMILGPTTLGKAERVDAAVGEHTAIIAALKARDAAAAEAAMRKHIEQAQGVRLRQLRRHMDAGDDGTV